VFALNLIVPLILSSGFTDGRAGIYAAIAFYWLLGLTACAARPSLGRLMVTGGAIVASTQLAPLLHVSAGYAAVTIGHKFRTVNPNLYGFVLVIVTGGLLLIAAYGSGRIWVSLENLLSEPSKPKSSLDDEL
jgi:hypothetical protein